MRKSLKRVANICGQHAARLRPRIVRWSDHFLGRRDEVEKEVVLGDRQVAIQNLECVHRRRNHSAVVEAADVAADGVLEV